MATANIQVQLLTCLGKHSDILDLAASFAELLPPQAVADEKWLGQLDPACAAAGIRSAISRSLPDVPAEVKAFLQPVAGGFDIRQRAFAIIDIVDSLVGPAAHPSLPTRPGSTSRLLQDRIRTTGRYNAEARFSVIPASRNLVAAPKALRSAFGRWLCFVSPNPRYAVRYTFVDGLKGPVKSQVQIAVIPAPYDPPSASHVLMRGSATHYEVRHSYSDAERGRISSALRSADGSCDIAVVAEAALDQQGFEKLRAEYSALGGLTSDGIQLLMLGHSGPGTGPGYNTVTVIKRTHDVAWQQAKVHSFDLSNKVIQDHQLPLPLLPNNQVYIERLDLPADRPPVVTVADTPFGRIVVAICEDFARPFPMHDTILQARATHVIVPVLDRELLANGWYVDFAQSLKRQGECTTVVCTSAFLERYCRRQGVVRLPAAAVPSVDDPVGVLLIAKPPSWQPPVITPWLPRSGVDWVSDAYSV